ncbi:MAG: transposase family protein [Candidatus Synoicihabitans palmerolidicus]|nr:transposase family protein [Candidatus Synoicihabitans palmerolidicus]
MAGPLHPLGQGPAERPRPHFAQDCRAGLRRASTGTLPLKNGQLPSLLEALCGVPDPRAKNTRFKIGPVLGLVALALLAGRRDIASIARMANLLDQDQRFALALPREAGKKVRLAPSYSVFYDVLTRLDPEALAQALNRWLTAHAGALPGALALAGKFIRDAVGVLSLVKADTGAPVALAIVDQKANTPRSEQARAGEVLAAASLDEQIVTPATPCTPPASRPAPSWQKEASMCPRSKGNQPQLSALVQRARTVPPPFLS